MKHFLKLLALSAVLACFAFTLPGNGGPKRKLTVVIDAGHGGKDLGAAYQGFTEKDIVRSVAEKVKAMNSDREITIYLTRSNDDFVELRERVETINQLNPDIVLSLHVNNVNNNETASGAEFFVADESASYNVANKYAQELESTFLKSGLSKSRGVKTGPFYILKKTPVPAISFQMGFLSNPQDRQYLTSEEGHQRMATIITDFIAQLK
ncbi:MAG: N-acetylmuramoyl-L-alanine amidase family protein [Flavobacterium sp.]